MEKLKLIYKSPEVHVTTVIPSAVICLSSGASIENYGGEEVVNPVWN